MYPLVSVIIPTYNRAHLIERAIHSVLNQTYQSIQLIIADDGSTDNTREVLASYPQVEYYYKENGGQASARNFGLQYTRGQYIASLDSDDMWMPTFLEEMINKMIHHNLDAAFANWLQHQPDRDPYPFLNNFKYTRRFFNNNDHHAWVFPDYHVFRSLYIKVCLCPSSGVIYKKDLMIEGWNNRMNIGDDWYLMINILTQNPKLKVGFTFKPLWYKHANDDNVYDGRDLFEIYKLLYFKDISQMMNDFAKRISKSELHTFKSTKFNAVMGMYLMARKLNHTTMKKESRRFVIETFTRHPLSFLQHVYFKRHEFKKKGN